MTNARASWNVICTQSVYLYNCPLFEATRVEYLLSDEKTAGLHGSSSPLDPQAPEDTGFRDFRTSLFGAGASSVPWSFRFPQFLCARCDYSTTVVRPWGDSESPHGKNLRE